MAYRNKNRNKNKKRKTGVEMGWWEKTYGSNRRRGSFQRDNREIPSVTTDNDLLSVVLYRQSSLDKIGEMCLPHADASEFQVHYRGIQIQFSHPDDERRLVFTIPTFFFNMKQTVTSGSVSFDLTEVAETSNMIAPLSQEMGNQIVDAFPMEYFTDRGFTVEVTELEMGSIHRHPGDFGFSSIDLDNSIDEPGVIFRTVNAQDKIQTDSVMYIPNKHVKIVTTETRIVDVEQLEDGGLKGQYAEAATINLIIKDIKTSFGFKDFFGDKKEQRTKYEFTVNSSKTNEKHPELEDIMAMFLDKYDYEPSLIIDPTLITQQYSHYKKPVTYHGMGQNSHIGNMWEDDGDDYYSEYKYPDSTPTPANIDTAPAVPKKPAKKLSAAEAETKRINARHTWKKKYALGVLRTMGINPDKCSGIDGTTSSADIISIVTEMKKISKTDDEINTFFTSADYPEGSLAAYDKYIAKNKNKNKKKETDVDKGKITKVPKTKVKTPTK